MKLKIHQVGHPVLRQQAQALTPEDILSARIQELLVHMRETLYDAPGCGLAAPQIGESLRIAVIDDKPEYIQILSAEQQQARERVPVPFHVIINPTYTITEDRIAEFPEGCLSVAGLVGVVPRAIAIKVECLNEHAKPVTINARGWYARILQHEIEHLQGKLCIDRTKMDTLTTIENYQRYWKK